MKTSPSGALRLQFAWRVSSSASHHSVYRHRPPQQEQSRFVNLSLLVSPEYPCTWPTFPRFQLNAEERIGPLSPYNSDIITIDGNTGTQLDVPPHSVTPPDSGFSNAGPFGRAYTDVVPAWQFGGEACVIDCRDLRRRCVVRAQPVDRQGAGDRLGEGPSAARTG